VAQVTLHIDKRSYDVACDDGQEEHLRALAADLDARVQKLRQAMGDNVEAMRLLVMTALFLEDELNESRGSGAPAKGDRNGAASNDEAAAALENVAERIESIAARLEGA
jgi:cell division protein ZapA